MAKKRSPGWRKLAKTMPVQTMAASLPTSIDHKNKSAWLLVVKGAEVDIGRHILCDHPITVGRDPSADLSLNDGSISRGHCSIERDAETGRYMLVDLGSTNGTVVNDTTVQGRIPLSEGDKVFLGASVLRFSFADEVDLEYHERLEEMVTTDPLTGMSTKRQYDATFADEADRARGAQSMLTVMVMDMDGLKQINDTYGHAAGGYSIATVGGIIMKVLQKHGHLCRFGGDEFVGCFPGMQRSRGRALAQEVRDRVADHPFNYNGVDLGPTISIGVATFPEDVADPGELFTTADRALYKAKRAGRNRVETINDSGPIDPLE